jgi:NitT/TauT family transport system substrate-binding protein
MNMTRSHITRLCLALALGGLATTTISGQAQTKPSINLKFALDFTIQGPQGMFLLALEKGYFAQEGLNVTIDRGFGSGDTVQKVAAGTYDMGFGDINSAIEFSAKNPNNAVIGVAMIYNTPPHAVMVMKNKGITTPRNLEGKTLAAPAGDAARRLFPVFAKAAGFDANKVQFLNVDAPLREPTLARGQADGITGFYFTSLLNLKALKVDESDVQTFFYGDYIKNLYGNAVVTTPGFAEKNPQAVRGFLNALTKAWKDTVANPDEAIAAVKKRDPLVNAELEKERLILVLKRHIMVRDVELFGFGSIRKDRLNGTIKLISEAFGLPVRLSADKVFNDKFLPPLESRLPPTKRGY